MSVNSAILELVGGCPPHLRIQMKNIHLKAGTFLLKEGDLNEYVYLLLSGGVQTYYYTDSGELFVSYVSSLDRYIFGELEAIRDTYSPILRNVIATEDSEFLKISRKVFLQWLREDPDFSLYIMRRLCDNVLRSTDYAITNAKQPLKKRCAVLLLGNCNEVGQVSFSKETLSGILATSLRSTNRILKELLDDGIIETEKKRITILDREALHKISQ